MGIGFLFVCWMQWIDCTVVTIDRLYLKPNDAFLKIGTSGLESNLDCAKNDKGWNVAYINLDMRSEYAKEIYSTLVAAHHSKSTYWIKTNGKDGLCYVTYVVSDT